MMDEEGGRQQGASGAEDPGFRAPRRRRKPVLAAGVAVFALVAWLIYLMARGPDPALLAAERVEALLDGLPVGALVAADIRGTAKGISEALVLDPGNRTGADAVETLQARVEAQIAEQIAAGALDDAAQALAAAAAAWPGVGFEDGGSLARRLEVAVEERELRAEVARLVAAAEERLLADGARERDGAALRDALKQLESALSIDPENARAQSVRADIAAEAKTATREALAAGEPDRARRLLDAVGGEWSDDSEFGGLRREVEGKLEALNRQFEVERLLGLASERLESDQLGQPAGDNAVAYYRRVLALSPGNETAEDGLARVGSRYAVLTRAAIGDDGLDRARRLHSSFGRAVPGHPEVARLTVEIEAAETAAAAARTAEAGRRVEAVQGAAAAGEASTAVEAPPTDEEGRLWHSVRDSCGAGDLQRYTTAYPAGRYVEEAWRRMSACLEARE